MSTFIFQHNNDGDRSEDILHETVAHSLRKKGNNDEKEREGKRERMRRRGWSERGDKHFLSVLFFFYFYFEKLKQNNEKLKHGDL